MRIHIAYLARISFVGFVIGLGLAPACDTTGTRAAASGSGGAIGAGSGGADDRGATGGASAGSGGAGGGAARGTAALGEPCQINNDCTSTSCFVHATITDCASAPTGICVSNHAGGNCVIYGPCGCLDDTTMCSDIAGTTCGQGSEGGFLPTGCFGCVQAAR